jgi:hypothetical protein
MYDRKRERESVIGRYRQIDRQRENREGAVVEIRTSTIL